MGGSKMQFKKLAAITGSALMAGLALAGPALATTVSQLGNINDLVTVTDSTVSFPLFVIGASAATSDVAGAVDVAVRLAANAKTTSTVTVSGAEETVTGGVKIRTVGNEFTPWQDIRNIKTVLTGSELDILSGGTYALSTGTTGTYKEYLYLGGTSSSAATTQPQIKYDTPTGETAPSLYLELPNDNIYQYLLTFSTPITMGTSDPADETALEGTTITMLGKDFVISDATVSSGAVTSLTLLGGGTTTTVETGESKTVTMGGKDYTVTLTSVASESIGGSTYYSAIGDVNGESFQLRAGQTKTLSDGTTIGVTKVFAPIVAGQSGYATFTIGGSKYVIPSSGTVTKDGASITGLSATITSSNHKLSSIKLTYAPSSTTYVKEGEKFTDPFVSAFDIKFNSFYPEFDDTTNRQTIQYLSSGPNVRLSYTNALGTTEQIDAFYYSGGTWYKGKTSTIDLVTDEYQNISASQGDYFVIGTGGFTHVLQFTSLDSTNNQTSFTDVGTGQAITVSYTITSGDEDGTLILDGFSYGIEIIDTTNKIIKVDLNGDGDIAGVSNPSGASSSYVQGSDYSYFVPKLITSGQGGLYIYYGNNTITPSATGTLAKIGMVPFNITNSSLTAGKVYVGTHEIGSIAASSSGTYINNVTGNAYSGYLDIVVTCAPNMSSCNVGLGTSATGMLTSPGFVLVEEALQGSTTHHWIYFPVSYSSTLVKAGITTPHTDDTNLEGNWDVVSGTTTYRGMSTYGTYTEYDTTSMSATIKYPDSFSYGNVYVLGPDATITTGGVAGEVTTETVLPITADVVKLDNEVTETDKTTKDLVLVGGPCVNSLVAELATAGKFPYTCADWPGRNFGRIQLITDAFATGKTALVIAGTRAEDTDLAARIVQNGFPGATDAQKAGSYIEVTGSVESPAYS
jgi:hypothetical protein